jgi:hypothetical protein
LSQELPGISPNIKSRNVNSPNSITNLFGFQLPHPAKLMILGELSGHPHKNVSAPVIHHYLMIDLNMARYQLHIIIIIIIVINKTNFKINQIIYQVIKATK